VGAIANAEFALSRDLAAIRVEPPVDLRASGTREDELLLAPAELKRVHELRSSFGSRSAAEIAAHIAGDVAATR